MQVCLIFFDTFPLGHGIFLFIHNNITFYLQRTIWNKILNIDIFACSLFPGIYERIN